jgi:hypothetical protein
MAEVGFALESNAAGVMGAAAPATTPEQNSGSGGCTVNANGRDAGLVMVLLGAMTGMYLRRRARRQRVE